MGKLEGVRELENYVNLVFKNLNINADSSLVNFNQHSPVGKLHRTNSAMSQPR